MKRKLKAAGTFGLCIILCMSIAGCSEKDNSDSEQLSVQSMEESVSLENSSQIEDNGETENNENVDNDSRTDEYTETETDSETEKSGEGKFYDGANLSGRVVEFSDTGFTITLRTLIINEDGSMEGGIAAPGYESEEDNITITYTEDTLFEIIYFSTASQAESSREDTDKSSIKKDTDVDIFGICQDEKQWKADKVVITRWQ